jgi:acetyl-CoA synthetase
MSSAQPASAVWSRVIANLDQDPREGLNTARECCERYATDRGRMALMVRHPDGRLERWTYFELAREAARAARMFASMGLRRGDRVAAVVSRTVEAWICALAAWRSGLVYVPLFYGFGSEALVARLRPAEAKALIVDHRWRGTVEDARGALADDLQIVTITGPRGTGLVRGDRSFWAEMERSAPDGPAAATAAGDVATMLFTSGTASAPKGCLMPHSGFVSLIPFVQHCFGLGRGDLLFATSDPGWAYGLYTCGAVPMALGMPRVIHSGDFDPAEWLRTIEAEQVTYIAAAPSAYRRVVAQARRSAMPSCLRGATSAGEPLDGDTVEGWQEVTGTEIRDGYGLSEVGMVLANLAASDAPVVPGALASVVPGFDVVLVAPDGTPVPDGEEGIIAIRRPPFQLSQGYNGNAAAWDARWVDDLFLTEDLARRDEQGRWWFTGRADDIIVTSGYNVGPVEVESVLLEHPGVAEAAAVAAPDPARGSVVRAVVVASLDAPPRETLTKELQDAVRSRVGRHAYPRIVEYVDALPRTETGKLRRAELRRQPQTTSA